MLSCNVRCGLVAAWERKDRRVSTAIAGMDSTDMSGDTVDEHVNPETGSE